MNHATTRNDGVTHALDPRWIGATAWSSTLCNDPVDFIGTSIRTADRTSKEVDCMACIAAGAAV